MEITLTMGVVPGTDPADIAHQRPRMPWLGVVRAVQAFAVFKADNCRVRGALPLT